MRYRLIVGALLGTTLVALTGCSVVGGTSASAPSRSPSPSGPPPAATLAAAVTHTTGISLTVTMAGDTTQENLTGSYDAAHGIGTIAQVSGADRMTIVTAADDMYLGGIADFRGRTMHLKISKLSPKSPFGLFTDLLSPLTLLTGATRVEATAPGTYTGTLDLTRVHGATSGAKKFVEYALSAAADRAGKVAFTASVSAQGYLSEFSATLPNIDSGKDGEFTVTYAGFGAAVTVKRPSGPTVVEAPASLYTAQ